MVRRHGQQDRAPGSHGPLAATPPPDRQPFLSVEPVDLLVVRIKALALEQYAQPAIAEPATLAGDISQVRKTSSSLERF
jgi:hypothetical protein